MTQRLGNNRLQDGSVTGNKIADTAVNSNNIVDGAITTTDLTTQNIETSTLKFVDIINSASIATAFVSSSLLYVNGNQVLTGGATGGMLTLRNLSVINTVTSASTFTNFVSTATLNTRFISTLGLTTSTITF
ncbi:MAG: hypothetical protein EBW76_06190, partial [Actinobacteria bacterium]|nr:hypothetical protein [Actinomycetota bacterium]